MNHFFSWRVASAVVCVGALGLLSGCGRSVGSVSGKVTYQGKSLKGGNVSFHSTEGGQSFSAAIKDDGSFEVPNLLGGSYKVCVETASLKGPSTTGGAPKGSGGSGGKGVTGGPKDGKEGKGAPPPDAQIPEGYTPSGPAGAKAAENLKKYVPIPDKYANPDTTDLTFTFKGGSETFNIDLK